MNVAFLMLTSAALAGADPAPAATPPAAPAVVTTGSGCGGGCGTCGDCCEGRGRKFHLRGLFHKGCCDDGCAPAPVCKPVCPPACPAPCPAKPVCCPAPKPCCPAPKPVCCPAPKPACPAQNDCCDSCGRHLFGRLKGLFHKHDCGCDGGCGGCCGAPAVAPAPVAPAQKMPTTIGSTGTIISPARIGLETEGARNPFDLHRRYEGRVSHADDYSKLTGELFFVHTDGGRWVVRYSPISKEDRYGGSVVLARDLNMDTFSEGDLVSIEGEVLADKSGVPLGGPLYRAGRATLVERGVASLQQ